MSDLTRYRIDLTQYRDKFQSEQDTKASFRATLDVFKDAGVLVPDTTLQDIADAVKAYKEFDYEPYINSDGDEPLENDPAHVLDDLLDGLVNDDGRI